MDITYLLSVCVGLHCDKYMSMTSNKSRFINKILLYFVINKISFASQNSATIVCTAPETVTLWTGCGMGQTSAKRNVYRHAEGAAVENERILEILKLKLKSNELKIKHHTIICQNCIIFNLSNWKIVHSIKNEFKKDTSQHTLGHNWNSINLQLKKKRR